MAGVNWSSWDLVCFVAKIGNINYDKYFEIQLYFLVVQ